MTVIIMRLSVASSPSRSTSSIQRASFATFSSITPSAFTSAKSRTRFNSRFAIRGVPRDLDAISPAPPSVISTPSIPAERVIIRLSSSLVYISRRLITPKRSLSGAVRAPAFVVAPISVNRGKSSRIDRADGPFPIIMSSAQSSIAGYRTSSTLRLSLCISSTNKMSFSDRLVRSAARSPCFSIAGPDVILMLTPISFAIIPASVVLPSPGGP